MCSVILAVRRCLLSRITVQQLCAVLFVAALLAVSPSTPAFAADDPTGGVKSLVDRTLAIVRNKEMSLAAKRGEFSMVGCHFDLA